jgi:outer membrane lipoprotein-sorting protein
MKAAVVLVLVLCLHSAFGQKPGGDEILRNAEQNFRGVNDYTVTLDIVTNLDRMKIPPMHATMYFKQPEKVHFDAKGFVVLPREGMGMQFGQLSQKYAVDTVTRETVDGTVLYRLALRPRGEKAVMRRMYLWVDGKRWTPERIRVPQPNGSAMEARFTYGRVNGFWLPTQLVATFTSAVKDTTPAAPQSNPFAGGTSIPSRGISRAGTVTVSYSEYKVNTGLPDSIFTAEQQR